MQPARRLVYRSLLILTLGLCGARASAAPPTVTLPADLSFFRQGQLTAPLAPDVFKADGEITPAEMQASAELRQFITFEAAARGDQRVTAHLAHTGDKLYVGFQVRRTVKTPPQADAKGRDSGALWQGDDSLEMRFFPTNAGYDLIGNSAGVMGDARFNFGTSGTNIPWDSEHWTYAARVTEDGWQGEFLIGAAFFGLESFPPGTTWRMDIFNNAKSDVSSCGWSYLGGLWSYGLDRLNLLTFGAADQPFQQQQGLGRLSENRLGLTATLLNPAAEERTVQVWAGFFRMQDGQSGAYWELLKGILDPTGIEILPGASYEELLAFAVTDILAAYVPAEELDTKLSVAPGAAHEVALRKPDLPGQYLVAWRFADERSGQVLSAGVYPFAVHPPLHTDLEYHYLVGQEVVARTVVAEGIAAEADRMRYTIRAGEQVLDQQDATVFAPGEILRMAFATADWPAGTYRLQVEALDGERLITQNEIEFLKPEPPFWWQSDAGKQIQVSWPWTPVEAEANAAAVWGRRMEWGAGILPVQLSSQQQPLLAAAPTLTARVNGQPAPFAWTSFGLTSAEPDVAVYEGQARAGDLALAARVAIEFDGMTRFDWTLSGADGQTVRLDELVLDIPVRRAVAELVVSHHDRIKKSGLVGSDPVVLRFSPSVILRNTYVGLEWFAECEEGWSNRDPQRLIEVLPADDEVVLRVRFVDKPVTLDRPRTLTWGWIAWPVKPWPEQDFNMSNYVGAPPGRTPEGYCQWEDGIPLAQQHHLNLVEWFHWNALDRIPDFPDFYNEGIKERVTRVAAIATKYGIPITGHSGFALPTDIADFEYYGMEMVNLPLDNKGRYGYQFTATPAYIDAYVARYKKVAQETGWSGIQSDGGLNVRFSENEYPGFGWRDEKGNLRGRYPIFAFRELTRRLYNVFHGEVEFPNLPMGFGHVTLHTYYPMGAIHGFVDSLHTGESRRSWGSFHTLDREMERASYPGRSFGVPLLCLPKLDKATHGGRGRIAFALMYNMNPLHNRILTHLNANNYEKKSYPGHLVWAARAWVGAHPEIYKGYWESQHLVSFDQADFYAALHVRPGDKALLGVINWLPDDRSVAATLNLEELGLPAATLRIADAITGESLTAPGGILALEVAGDGYRLLKIWSE